MSTSCSGELKTKIRLIIADSYAHADSLNNAYWTFINIANSKQANIILIRLAESMFYLSFKINA